MKSLRNITVGHPENLTRAVFFTILANLVTILPFVLVIEVVKIIFEAYSSPAAQLEVTRLWWICGALVISMILIFLAERPAYRSCYRGAYAVAAEGRMELAEHLRKLPLGFLSGRDPGDLANMLMGDFALLEHSISHQAPQFIGALVMPVLAFIGLCFLDWRMALAMFVALPVALLIFFGSTKLIRYLGAQHMRAKINAGNRLQEYLYGIRVIKAYNLTGSRFERLEKSFRELMQQSIRLEGLVGPFAMLAITCMRFGLTIMILVGVHLLAGGTLSLIVFVTFLLVGSRIFDPLTLALINYAEMHYSEQAGERILNLYQEPKMSGSRTPPVESGITFENVSFGYQDKKDVVHSISAQMQPGTLTALVGPSGSGKSTLLKLAARFYDPSAGKVLIGGEPMHRMKPEELFKKMSMVFQDVYLFKDTIGNNIRFGREGASDDEVINAARKACCHEFIEALPNGYDTPVGEGGCTLSGGEKQRISIARAFLKNAPIILLDEATASLDPENELEVQQAIDTLIRGRTVIVVAHRLKTICRADRIYVLNEGRVEESGTHEELLLRDGLYANLWNLQQESTSWSLAT